MDISAALEDAGLALEDAGVFRELSGELFTEEVNEDKDNIGGDTTANVVEDEGGNNCDGEATASASSALNNDSPTMCLYITGHDWDHYLLFALTEINSGFYNSTLGDNKFQHKILYANPSTLMVEGEAQDVFSTNYKSCHLFVGPAWSTQLSAIGEWAGLKQKPIVSGGATNPDFAQDNFGYVSRSIPSDQNVLEAFVQIIVEYELPLINIVYVNNDYGRSTTEALIELAKGKFEIQLLRAFDSKDDMEGINSVLDDLEASPTHATFLSMTLLPLTDFLNIAGRRGMHLSHLWLSPAAIQVADKLDPPPTGGIWGVSWGEELAEDSPLAQRYLAKDPAPHIEAMKFGMNDEYDTLTYWGTYGYDAVLAAAHGLAAATNRSDGEEVLKEIRALSLDFANSGLLEMDENGDRIGARIPIFYLTPAGTAEKFAVYYKETVDFLRDPVWPECQDLSCVNNSVRPVEDMNFISDGLIILGYALFAIEALAATLALGWMVYNREKRVVKASQPEFLSLVAIGCLMIASAILPLSIEGGYRFEGNVERVDVACMAVPWLICIGFVLIYSALFAKLRRVNEIITSAQSFIRVQVPRKSVAVTVFAFFALVVVILLTWQLVSPMIWERTVTATTFSTGFPTGSFGRCTSEHSAVFAGISAGFIGVCLACSLFLSYKTRHISLEFAESKYIVASVFYLLQLLVLGVPILIIAREDTDAFFAVFSLILFLVSFGTTGLIFLPKIVALRKGNESSSGLPAGNLRSSINTDRLESLNSVEQIRKRVSARSMAEKVEEDTMGVSPRSSGVSARSSGVSTRASLRTSMEEKVEEDTMEEEKV